MTNFTTTAPIDTSEGNIYLLIPIISIILAFLYGMIVYSKSCNTFCRECYACCSLDCFRCVCNCCSNCIHYNIRRLFCLERHKQNNSVTVKLDNVTYSTV